MALYVGNKVVPKENAGSASITRLAYSNWAQPFTARDRDIEGVYWYYTAKNTSTGAAMLQFCIYADSASGNVPIWTDKIASSVGTRGMSENTLYYIPFQSVPSLTEGARYWVGFQRSGSWSFGRGFTFACPSSSDGNYILVASSEPAIGVESICVVDNNYTDAMYDNFGYNTLTGYRLPIFPKFVGMNYGFLGQPYIAKKTLNTNTNKSQRFYYSNVGQSFGLPEVYVNSFYGNPGPLYITYTLESNGRSISTALVSTPGFTPGWHGIGGTVGGFETAGSVLVTLASSSGSYWFVISSQSKFRELSYGTSGAYYTASASQDLPIIWTYDPPLSAYNGYITEYSQGSAVPGTSIYFYEGATLRATAKSNNTGYYSKLVVSGKTYNIIPKKYDWEFEPSFVHTVAVAETTKQVDFVQSSESVWWGHSANHHGKAWSFRQRVSFATPHPTLPVGHLVDIPVQTGNMIRIASSGYFNEAIQHSMSNSICYVGGKTFCAWLQAGEAVNIAGATYDWASNTWTNHGIICTGVGTWFDTHYYPNLWSDKHGYLYLCRGGHNLTAEYMYITKTATPYSLISFPKQALTGTVLGTDENTYPRIAYDAEYDRTYIIYRYQAGDLSNTYTKIFIRDKDGNYKRPNGSSYTSPSNFIRYNVGQSSIYLGGFKIDKDGTLHCVWNPLYDYGGDNIAKAIGYAYSPKYPGSTAGVYWYNIWGHTVNTQAAVPGDIIPFTEDGGLDAQHSPFVVYSYSSAEAWNAANRFYHTNTEGLFIHPTRTINNGTHTIRAPYFTFHAYPKTDMSGGQNINNLSDGYVCFFDSAYSKTSLVSTPWLFNGKDNILNGWVAHTVTSTAISGTSVKLMKGRHYGSIMIDNSELIHIYGVVRPPDYAGSDYWAGELWEWTSKDGHSFTPKKLTDKSAKGAGMTNFKESLTNDAIEGLYCRGNDIIYISDSEKYPRFKTSGNDIRVVYASASSKASEINSLGNFYSYVDSHVYFPIKRSVPSTWSYDTAGNYYIYYGRYDTAQVYGGPNPDIPYRNPDDVCEFFDNFEKYPVGTKVNTAVSTGQCLSVSTSAWQYVAINNHTTFNFTATTMAINCWIKTTNQQNGYIVCKPYTTSSPTGVEWGLGVNNQGHVFMRMRGTYFANTSNAVDDGNWHNVGMQADGTYWNVYVDGASDFDSFSTKPSNASSLSVYIGSDRLGNNRFGGKIDNLWFYRGLSSDELIYLNTASGNRHFPSSLPLACFNFNNDCNELLGRYTTVGHSVVYATGLVNIKKWADGNTLISADFKDVNNIKIYSGYQNLYAGSTAKTYFPAVSNCAIRVGHWNENDNVDCGVKIWYHKATAAQWVYFNHDGFNQNWQFLSSPWQLATTATTLVGPLKAPSRRMHEYIIYVHSTHGVSFQTEQGATFFANNISGNLGYNKMAMHSVNAIELVRNNGVQYFDFVRVYKTYSTPSPYQVF